MKTIADRVRELERRVVAVETNLGLDASDRRPVPESPVQTPVVELAPPPPRPQPAPPRPQPAVAPPVPPRALQKSLEVNFGRWMSRLGGLALVVAAGFLFAYAAKRDLITPPMRVLLGLVTGAGLVAAGEWQNRRIKNFAAVLTGAGLGILFVTVYAGYWFAGLFSVWTAFALATIVTVGGIVQALRHRVEAIAGLAALGAFLAPVIVLQPHAQPVETLAYILLLNVGLAFVRMRTGWYSTEFIAWLGTPVVVAAPLSEVSLGTGLPFLLAYTTLFGIRPRLQGDTHAATYTLALAAINALVSFALFEHHGTAGWEYFAGGMAVVHAISAAVGAKRDERVATADGIAAVAFAALALMKGLTGWHVTIAWGGLGLALLLPPLPRLRRQAQILGATIAVLATVHLAVDAMQVSDQLLAYLVVAAAIAAIRTRPALWTGVGIAALGLAVQVARARGADPWWTLLFATRETLAPTTRLLACGTLAIVLGAFAYMRRNRAVLKIVVIYLGLLGVAEALYLIDGIGRVPLGLVAAAALLVFWGRMRTIWMVAGALVLAVAADLMPPADYLPFLNRRAFGIGAVLGVGWLLLRGSPEGRATALMAMLLGVAEAASVPDRIGGVQPWTALLLDLRTTADVLPLWNTRFLFLTGAAATAFVAARTWSRMAIVGHLYVVAAIGAEVVGLVNPSLRSNPWYMFYGPGSYMGPQLALTFVILGYGTGLVTCGILRGRIMMRRVGLGLLILGGLKVSFIDTKDLHDLYRVGSFVLLGGTYLLGSYAYNRWITATGERRVPADHATDPEATA